MHGAVELRGQTTARPEARRARVGACRAARRPARQQPAHSAARQHARPTQQRQQPLPHGAGVPLVRGLRQLRRGAEDLVGWTVVVQLKPRQYEALGVVEQVANIQPAYQLLRVVQRTVLQPYGFAGTEAHTLPLVPDIVPALHPQQRLVVVTPPPGLLELGRRELLLAVLARELPRLAAPAQGPLPAAGTLQLPGAQPLARVLMMPTRAALLAVGRADLVNLVQRVGGFTQAALLLGMRCSRRPAGYWDSLEVLDVELDQFIAGCWVALPAGSSPAAAAGDGEEDAAAAPAHDGGGDEVYFYNLATRAIRWTMPDAALGAAAAHAGDAGQPAAVMDRAAQQALVELQQERVMPSRAALQAAGRWDLHHAITGHGGYGAVAEALGRRLCRGIPEHLLTPKGLKAALADAAVEEGWPAGRLPTSAQLREADRPELARAIAHFGGSQATAELLQLQYSKRQRRRTPTQPLSLQDAVRQLREFMARHTPPSTAAAAAAAAATGGVGRSRLAHLLRRRRAGTQQVQGTTSQQDDGRGMWQALQQQQLQQQQDAAGWRRLPTQAQLLAAGRRDLVCALRQHGYDAVQQQLGGALERPTKPLRRGVLQWQDVAEAVAAGCHTARDILGHVSAKHAPGDATPLVSQEHLTRRLRAWCLEGRLVKPGFNNYQLP